MAIDATERSEVGKDKGTGLAGEHANMEERMAAGRADAAAAAMREHLAWAVSQDVKATEERR